MPIKRHLLTTRYCFWLTTQTGGTASTTTTATRSSKYLHNHSAVKRGGVDVSSRHFIGWRTQGGYDKRHRLVAIRVAPWVHELQLYKFSFVNEAIVAPLLWNLKKKSVISCLPTKYRKIFALHLTYVIIVLQQLKLWYWYNSAVILIQLCCDADTTLLWCWYTFAVMLIQLCCALHFGFVISFSVDCTLYLQLWYSVVYSCVMKYQLKC